MTTTIELCSVNIFGRLVQTLSVRCGIPASGANANDPEPTPIEGSTSARALPLGKNAIRLTTIKMLRTVDSSVSGPLAVSDRNTRPDLGASVFVDRRAQARPSPPGDF